MKKPLFWLALFIIWIVVAYWLFNKSVLSLKEEHAWPADDEVTQRFEPQFQLSSRRPA